MYQGKRSEVQAKRQIMSSPFQLFYVKNYNKLRCPGFNSEISMLGAKTQDLRTEVRRLYKVRVASKESQELRHGE